MIMLTKQESIKLINTFLQEYLDYSEEVAVISRLHNLAEMAANNKFRSI